MAQLLALARRQADEPDDRLCQRIGSIGQCALQAARIPRIKVRVSRRPLHQSLRAVEVDQGNPQIRDRPFKIHPDGAISV
ncbi:hypothetical protein [Novosphingobium sp. B 225]|uniref:hypothetical protein n=1 Tax=Novosphingobium sp. B 225 TaxID=1961849 RepID=UPI0011250A1B|nr:hypothetical protein [Novosphingobium sp. B 225]